MRPRDRRRSALLAAAAAAVLPSSAIAWEPSELPRHRVALVVSSSAGSPGKARLPGATADGLAFADLLRELGGVASSDLVHLSDPDTSTLFRSLSGIRDRMREDSALGVPTELVVYVAGHARIEGLELANQLVPWDRFREGLRTTGARTRVAILDACASGAALRSRGRFVVPAPTPLRGEAWMVSSRAEEVSLETDADGGGIFTRILLSGLRGAADRDRDGKVTFEEAFQHVSTATQSRARGIGAASQTPQWASSLEGDRPLDLTDLRRGTASLRVFPRTLGILLADSADRGIAWVPPDTGASTLALAPGLYTAWSADGGIRKAHRFRLERGESRRILPEEFVAVGEIPDSLPRDTSWNRVPVNFGLLSPLTLNGFDPSRAINHFSLDLVLGEAGWVRGFQMAGILTRVHHGVSGAQVSSVANLVEGDVTGFQLGTVNLLDGGATGLQAGLALNLDDGRSRGLQLAGLMNVNRDSLWGAQVASASSYAGSLRGGQVSLVNVAGSMHGVQVGLVNIAREARGAQVGLVNVALRSSGLAVGAVNVLPRSRTLAVGPVNVGQDLTAHPVLGISPDGVGEVSVRYGTSWWRTILLARSPEARLWEVPEAHRWGLGAGVATRGRLSAGVDLLLTSPSATLRSPQPGVQVDLGWRILPRLSPGAGLRWTRETPDEVQALLLLAL